MSAHNETVTAIRRPDDEIIAPTDVANLVFDSADRVNAFVLAGHLGPGGFVRPDGSIDLDRARTVLLPRAAAVPRFRQRADTSERVWRWREAAVDPARHIRVVEAASLEELCAGLLTTRLDHAYPLWEIVLVPRLGSGGAGIVIRIHHAVADGLASAVLVAALADTAPVAAGTGARHLEHVGAVRARVGQFRRVVAGPKVPPSALLGPTGGPRSVRFVDVDLTAFRAGVAEAGGTVNDGVLAAVAGAVVTTLSSLGENPPDSVAVSVPVGLKRRRGEGNAIGAALVPLPLGIDDRVERIRAIHASAGPAITDARHAGTFPPMRSRWMMRRFDRYSRSQRTIGLVTSNVPGPDSRIVFDTAPLLDMHGVGTLGGNVRISIVAASYAGVLGLGINTAAAIPADTLADALTKELTAIAAPDTHG
ncbi:hypothetical protein GORHZ_060_00380 [Gordonia rhizosphera NBRC 16068]|uniref:diacylglycerol O-acyltransferase n=1 Tax=Gordonia rhizosphera NBRC 16068 TaxID=1108045 RepID=K6W6R4_9ACTN|nr:hypothetical protein GORHZ_060_00380 [Gordonia rhizosphera NBRC 16068]